MTANADPIRFLVATRHSNAGRPDYWMTRVDATLDGYADWDGTTLMLGAMVRYVGPMLAGDMTRVTIIRGGEIWHSYRGRPERDDRRLNEIANSLA